MFHSYELTLSGLSFYFQKMFSVGRSLDMTPLSLESICFKKIIKNKNKPHPTTETLTRPLMKQWVNLLNIVSSYRINFATINITNTSGLAITNAELLERIEDEADRLPTCFERITVAWPILWEPAGLGPVGENLWTPATPSPAEGIEISFEHYEPILFDWNDDYNYDIAGCNFSRVFYKGGKIIKETWFREEENHLPLQTPPVKQCLMSVDALSLSEDGSLIYHISKFIPRVPFSSNGRIQEEDLIMKWTVKAFRITHTQHT
jgi:hypothetical protein